MMNFWALDIDAEKGVRAVFWLLYDKLDKGEVARFVFEHYWLAIEVISLLLLVGLLAAVLVGRGKSEDMKAD